jgi:hypothetical protein
LAGVSVMLAGLRGPEPGVNAGSFRRLRDDESDVRGERRSSSGLSGRKPKGWTATPYNLIQSTVEGNSSPRLGRPPAGRRGPSQSAQRRCVARGGAPTSYGEQLSSPTGDEVPENRSGGTTIESGAPSSGRDAALNAARPARRHRRLHSQRQQTGQRTELPTVARADRCGAAALCCPSARRVTRGGGEVRFLRSAGLPPAIASSRPDRPLLRSRRRARPLRGVEARAPAEDGRP